MARPLRLDAQRSELLPILAKAFSELGYRRTTTAELARRCGVRENILYRHWNDKLAMFVAALDHVHELAIATWQRVRSEAAEPSDAATAILAYESHHLGEFGNYRILFSALGDADDPAIRAALRRTYRSLHRAIRDALGGDDPESARASQTDRAAWAILGVGTITTILGELGLATKAQRAALLEGIGRVLIEAAGDGPRDGI